MFMVEALVLGRVVLEEGCWDEYWEEMVLRETGRDGGTEWAGVLMMAVGLLDSERGRWPKIG